MAKGISSAWWQLLPGHNGNLPLCLSLSLSVSFVRFSPFVLFVPFVHLRGACKLLRAKYSQAKWVRVSVYSCIVVVMPASLRPKNWYANATKYLPCQLPIANCQQLLVNCLLAIFVLPLNLLGTQCFHVSHFLLLSFSIAICVDCLLTHEAPHAAYD